MAMKTCKECNQEISSSAKACPNCGRDQRNFFMKHKIISIIGVVVIIAIIGSAIGGGDNNASVNSGGEGSNASSNETAANIGDVITTDKFEIVVTNVEERTTVGTQYFESTASEGGKYIVVSWQYKNISDKPIGSFSTPSLYLIDGNNNKYDNDIDASSNYATEVELDSKIFSDLNPGITVKDADVFEVSKELYDAGGWSLKVDADKDCFVTLN